MSRLKRIFALMTALDMVLLVLAWAPWMTSEHAQSKAVQDFNSAWKNVADGCGFNCAGCGAKRADKAPFGYWVTIEYACGLLPSDSPALHRTDVVFVSVLGTVHGLQRP